MRHRVLLIDENSDDQAIYVLGLQALGFDVRLHPTVAESVVEAATFRPDVIVLHLGTGQWHLCDELHDHSATRRVPVVVITASVRPDRQNRDRALHTENCAAFVGKPCTHEEVASVIRRVLEGERHIELLIGRADASTS